MNFREKLKKLRNEKTMIGIKDRELLFGGFIADIEKDSVTFWGRQKIEGVIKDPFGYGFRGFGGTPPQKTTTMISNISIFDISEVEKQGLKKFFKKQKLSL